ncbi:hypothetical protein BJ912DRAFT_969702 [Pholiota molesta]|nr:hypothetical protein BJ912DRAFT_969702 [Pholiota molesta]
MGALPHDDFTFKQPVPQALADDILRRRGERELRRQLEATRARNQLRLAHSVVLVAFLESDAEPRMIPVQDISPWPNVNIQTISGLARMLGLSDLSDLELFVTRNSCWIPTVDFVMALKPDEKIFLRRRGLLPGASPFLDLMPVSAGISVNTPSRRKRAFEPSSPVSSTSKSCRFTSPSRSSSPLRSEFSPPPANLELPLVTQSSESHVTVLDDDLDDRNWLLGFVLTPSSSTAPWPAGMYVRDMAKGFDLIKASQHKHLEERFIDVFPGKPYKHSAFFRNRGFWNTLPAHVRFQASSLPRTEAGLWTEWRKGQSTWK